MHNNVSFARISHSDALVGAMMPRTEKMMWSLSRIIRDSEKHTQLNPYFFHRFLTWSIFENRQ